MKYTKKELDRYKADLVFDMFKTEIAMEENQIRLKKFKKERDDIQSQIQQKEMDWGEARDKKKERLSKEDRETIKSIMEALQVELVALKGDLDDVVGRESNSGQNIIMYEEFLKTAELSLELATKKIGNKV